MHHLRERTVVSIKGKDATSFLQGLLTQDITKASADKLLYSLALTPQGKILYDCFILKAAEEEYLLDLPFSYLTQAMAHLQSYKLRAKVEFADLSESHAVYITQQPAAGLSVDPRGNSLWQRGILATEQKETSPESTYATYHSQRIIAKIVDYDYDLEPGNFFPWIVGLTDAAVDYNKGCYIGQEVNARARWKEGSRKKLITLSLAQPIARYTAIMQGEKNVGTLLGGVMAPKKICHSRVGGNPGLYEASAATILDPRFHGEDSDQRHLDGSTYLALALVKHELLDGSPLTCKDIIVTEIQN